MDCILKPYKGPGDALKAAQELQDEDAVEAAAAGNRRSGPIQGDMGAFVRLYTLLSQTSTTAVIVRTGPVAYDYASNVVQMTAR